MNISMVTAHDKNLEELSEITYYKNKILYCRKHGYKLIAKTDNFRTNIKPHFDKIHFLLESAKSNPDVEWFWWLDADALITNFNIKIEEFTNHTDSQHYHCIIGSTVYEWNMDINSINNGSFLMRNSVDMHKFLEEIISEESNHLDHPWQDQGSMITVLNKHDRFRKITKLLPMRAFNSLDYTYWDNLGWKNKDIKGRLETTQWQPGDFVIHWPGVPLHEKICFAKKYLSEIIN